MFELADGTGADVAGTVASPVAGIRYGSGVEMGPPTVDGVGLFVAVNPPSGQGNDRIVRMLEDRTTVQTVVDFGNLTTNPADIAFDATRMYVVTASDVRVYTHGGVPINSFAHGLVGGGGQGTDEKPLGIAVSPTTGHVFVTGRTQVDSTPTFSEDPMIRVFDPNTGVPVDDVDGTNSLGNAAIALTGQGHTGSGGTAFMYTFEIGDRRLQVYDASLNSIIRTIDVATVSGWPVNGLGNFDGDNVLGMDIDPVTGDIYLVYTERATNGSSQFGTRFNVNETFGNHFAFNTTAFGVRDVTIGTFVPEPAAGLAALAPAAFVALRRGRGRR